MPGTEGNLSLLTSLQYPLNTKLYTFLLIILYIIDTLTKVGTKNYFIIIKNILFEILHYDLNNIIEHMLA